MGRRISELILIAISIQLMMLVKVQQDLYLKTELNNTTKSASQQINMLQSKISFTRVFLTQI